MKALASRLSAQALLALVAVIVLAAAGSPKGAVREPGKLIIESTTDVKGRTSPCG
jgi:hypothetical protein